MNKIKYLTDKEILNWNKLTQKYYFNAGYSTESSYPTISVFERKYSDYGLNSHVMETSSESQDHFMKFNFKISISSNRIKFFFDIFNKISKMQVVNRFLTNNDILPYKSLKLNPEIVKEIKKIKYKIKNKKYTLHDFLLEGQISEIMVYVSYLEDTIEFFNKVYGYDDENNETKLMQFGIGDIVSKKGDKSKDYLILDYEYNKEYNKYVISYTCAEIADFRTPAIKFGEVTILEKDNVCFSRNKRIDDILN